MVVELVKEDVADAMNVSVATSPVSTAMMFAETVVSTKVIMKMLEEAFVAFDVAPCISTPRESS